MLLWLGLVLALAAASAREETEGWVRRGPALAGEVYPACYQLWVCMPAAAPGEQAGPGQRPRGTWGTCENLLQGRAFDCGQCLAPEPMEPCPP